MSLPVAAAFVAGLVLGPVLVIALLALMASFAGPGEENVDDEHVQGIGV